MKYLTSNQVFNIVLNKTEGNYILKYWNLHSDCKEPEVIQSNFIEGGSGEYNLVGYEEYPFPLHEDTNIEINRLNNDHYQFSLFKI